MEKNETGKRLENVITVLAGGLLLGFLWRVRGTCGWGSSWGLLNAGFVFSLFVISVKGSRQKMQLGWTALTALSFMLTVPGWGTLLSQITGLLPKTAPDGTVGYVEIPVMSAVFLMLCLGFGLAVLFGIMLGRGLSEKQWRLRDFIWVLAVFYAADLLAKVSISHIVLHLIQPQSARIFEEALAAKGIDGGAWKAFLTHFNNVSWAKKIDGGRNYFASVQAVSAFIRSAAALLAVKFIVKDNTSAKTGFAVSSAFAFAITAADLFFYFDKGGYHMEHESFFGDFIAAWPSWEYFTGFTAGIIITAFLLQLRTENDLPELAFSRVPARLRQVLTFTLGYVFLIGVNIVRPVLDRMDGVRYHALFTAAAVLTAAVFIALLAENFGFEAQKTSMTDLANVLLSVFSVYIFVIYMFVPSSDEPANCFAPPNLHNLAVTISFATIFVMSLLRAKKEKNRRSGD